VVADGLPFQYTVTLTNNGPSDATGVTLSDTLPAGVTLVSATTASGATPAVSGGVVTVSYAKLAGGASDILTITVNTTATPGSTLVDSATVQGAQADPDLTNNSDALSLPVRGVSDLAVAASTQPTAPHVGQPLTYTIVVTNNGPNDEPDAVLSSILPPGLTVD